MVDWMVEDNLFYCRVVLLCNELLLSARVCWPRFLVIDHVYKGRVSLIVNHHWCEIICEVLVRERS